MTATLLATGLLLPAAASAGGSFRGTTDEGQSLGFRTSSKSLIRFTTQIEVRCVNEGPRMDTIALPDVRVRNGRFEYDGMLNGSYVFLEGRLLRGRATGKLRFVSNGSGDWCGSSSVRWKARRSSRAR